MTNLTRRHHSGPYGRARAVVPAVVRNIPVLAWPALACLVLCLAIAPALAEELPEQLGMIAHQARSGDPNAQLLFGLAYLEGRYGLPPDAGKAAYWLLRAARDGQPYAALEMGKLYAAGTGVGKDPQAAVYWWRKAADKGMPEAQYRLGKAYLEGFGVKKDPAEAVHWLREAAENGSHDAEFELGKMYQEGYTVAQDKGLAQDWLSRAARSGHSAAINLLGVLKGLRKYTGIEYQKPASALIEEARNGDPVAQYELGLRYETGAWGVTRDEKKALYWLNKAADNGNHHAMATLAHIYAQGQLGVPRDPEKAAYWEKRAQHYR